MIIITISSSSIDIINNLLILAFQQLWLHYLQKTFQYIFYITDYSNILFLIIFMQMFGVEVVLSLLAAVGICLVLLSFDAVLIPPSEHVVDSLVISRKHSS